MDLQNNTATKVAALDERGVTLERDGKATKFIPWGEDAEARAAAATAQATADKAKTDAATAKKTASEAKTAAGEAAAKAGELEAETDSLDERVTALEDGGGGAGGDYVKLESDTAQTAGHDLAAVNGGWSLEEGTLPGDAKAISLAGIGGMQARAAITETGQEEVFEASVQNGFGAQFQQVHAGTNLSRTFAARGWSTASLDGEEVDFLAGEMLDVYGGTAVHHEFMAHSAETVKGGVPRRLINVDVRLEGQYDPTAQTEESNVIEIRYRMAKNDGSAYAIDRIMRIHPHRQTIVLSRNGEERTLDLWELAGRAN